MSRDSEAVSEGGNPGRLHSHWKLVPVFLQGLFFLPVDKVEPWLPEVVEPLTAFEKIVNKSGRPAAEILLAYVRDKVGVGAVVLGMDNLLQLNANIGLWQSAPLSEELRSSIEAAFDNVPEQVLNPSLWRKERR